MELKLRNPFEYDGVRYDSINIPDYLQLGHRRLYAKYQGLQGDEVGIALCAALCEMPEVAFDRISIADFERVTQAVRRLFEDSAGKKPLPQPKRKTLRK
ncbi:MAG TPA: phage tail assembly protein [Oligoflexus sp.]|uniref:phage tail assembly protein n=1 Tax=Oligoflexus sp. TaxID=1971216 RepID=UPI002D3D3193|nr:phage tail assembly protein [Oligoflexus sp.]HYX35323.1 phage tail assembly protein [Oligoflexus sp.]